MVLQNAGSEKTIRKSQVSDIPKSMLVTSFNSSVPFSQNVAISNCKKNIFLTRVSKSVSKTKNMSYRLAKLSALQRSLNQEKRKLRKLLRAQILTGTATRNMIGGISEEERKKKSRPSPTKTTTTTTTTAVPYIQVRDARSSQSKCLPRYYSPCTVAVMKRATDVLKTDEAFLFRQRQPSYAVIKRAAINVLKIDKVLFQQRKPGKAVPKRAADVLNIGKAFFRHRQADKDVMKRAADVLKVDEALLFRHRQPRKCLKQISRLPNSPSLVPLAAGIQTTKANTSKVPNVPLHRERPDAAEIKETLATSAAAVSSSEGSTAPTDSTESDSSQSVGVSLDGDGDSLMDYNCKLKKQIEFFET